MATVCTTSYEVTHGGEVEVTVDIGTTLNQRLLELIAVGEALVAALGAIGITHEVAEDGVLNEFLDGYLTSCCP